jgi:hypothetical protein
MGKRRFSQGCRQAVLQILDLADKGYMPSTISASVGLDEPFVRLVLEKAGEVRGGRGKLCQPAPVLGPMAVGVKGKLSVIVHGASVITQTTKTNAAGGPPRAASVGGAVVRRRSSPT